jgi:hypothetical protein
LPTAAEADEMPFKHHAGHRHRCPRAEYRVTNWSTYEAGLRQRGSLTLGFSEEAIAAGWAAPRGPPGGQARYSAVAIETTLTLRAVFRLAFRQAEGLVGSLVRRLGLDPPVPDHATLSRRARTLEVTPRPRADGPLHLLVDSTGLKLGDPGAWRLERHGSRRRRSWSKLHSGVDAAAGAIVAVALSAPEVDEASQVGPVLDQVPAPVASVVGDGAYDREDVDRAVEERHPGAAVVVPPRSTAVPSGTAATAPTQRDRHVQLLAENGRMAWQRAAGYGARAKAAAAIQRFQQVLGDRLRAPSDAGRRTEVVIASNALNRRLSFGRANDVRVA